MGYKQNYYRITDNERIFFSMHDMTGPCMHVTLAIFTLETDYLLDNSRQTDWIRLNLNWNGTVLILEGQSGWLYPFVFPSILTDFEDESVSSVKTATDARSTIITQLNKLFQFVVDQESNKINLFLSNCLLHGLELFIDLHKVCSEWIGSLFINFHGTSNIVAKIVDLLDHFTFLGNCSPTPPLSQHFACSRKLIWCFELSWALSPPKFLCEVWPRTARLPTSQLQFRATNFVAFIPSRSIRQIMANFSRIEFQSTSGKEKKIIVLSSRPPQNAVKTRLPSGVQRPQRILLSCRSCCPHRRRCLISLVS